MEKKHNNLSWKISRRFIKNIINGKWQIYEETENKLYIYYTQMAFTYSYGEYYFYNEDKSFRLKDYGTKWFITKR